MNEILANNIEEILSMDISEDRIANLQPLIDYIKSKREKSQPIRLNFTCTHISRRSLWLKPGCNPRPIILKYLLFVIPAA